jgi:uncharacterized membrane protein
MAISGVVKTTAVYLALDLLYLGVLQRQKIGDFFNQLNQAPLKVKMVPGLVAWVLLGWGLEHFVLSRTRSTKDAMVQAALLGLLVYGVYDMTNLATLPRWTLSFSLADMLWGSIVMALVVYVRRKFVH